MEILAQSSTAFVLTHNFQGTHIFCASRGRLSDSVASCELFVHYCNCDVQRIRNCCTYTLYKLIFELNRMRILNKMLSCCCDSRSYRCCQTANPINNYYCGSASTNSQSAHLCMYTALQSAHCRSARHTPRSRRSHRTALCRLTAVERNAATVYQYWDVGLRFVFLWCILWLNDTSYSKSVKRDK